MGKCLAIRGNLLFTELPIKCTIEDISDLLGISCLAVLVSVANLLRGGLVEKECDKARYDW